jgi:hypothetical protein
MTETLGKLDKFIRPAGASDLDLPIELSFSCFGGEFVANAEDTSDGAVISVEGVVGTIPFSAESPEARANLRALLAQRPSSEIVWLERADRNRIILRGRAPLGENPSKSGAVAALSAVLSAGKPLIDILVDCGARTAMKPTGFDGVDVSTAAN